MKLPTVSSSSLDHFAIGVLARDARLKAKLSLREVADRLGVKSAYLSDLERGRRNWTQERFEQFKKALR